MTYDHEQSTVIVGPLATQNGCVGYDLCKLHADRLSVPRGWEVIRLADSFAPPPPNDAELMALADAVRAASHSDKPRQNLNPSTSSGPVDRRVSAAEPPRDTHIPGVRRGHLTLIEDVKSSAE